MSVVYCPICLDCKHKIRDNKTKDVAFCAAYPEGIPYEVWKEKSKQDININEHYPNGYKFKHD